MPKRVVFDTNVLVSGYIWNGPPRQALEAVRSELWILLGSDETFKELVKVLSYEKLGLSANEIEPILRDLEGINETVETSVEIEAVSEDPKDNIFLSLAVSGKADFIVSGDRHLLNLKSFRGIQIVTVVQFLRISPQNK